MYAQRTWFGASAMLAAGFSLVCASAFAQPSEGSLGASVEGLLAAGRRLSPALRAASLETMAAGAKAAGADKLDDPTISDGYQFYRDPGVFSAHTVMLSQSIPLWGKLDLRRDAAIAELEAARGKERAAEDALDENIKVAYAIYYLTAREIEINQHIGELDVQMHAAASARYNEGGGDQSAIIQASDEETTAQTEIIKLQGDEGAARARLNALVGRPADAPLAEPQRLRRVPAQMPALQILLDRSLSSNPTLSASQSEISAAKARKELADKAWYPDITLGSGPIVQTNREPVGFAATVGLNIPVPWGRESSDQAQATAQLGASEAQYDAATHEVEGALGEALAKLRASRKIDFLLQRESTPQARAMFQTLLANYSQGKGDLASVIAAEHQLHEVDLRHLQALLDEQTSFAAVERLVGGGNMMRRLSLTLAMAGVLSSGFAAAEAIARQPLYYQDPDGKPFYSAAPRKAPDGRAYTAIFTDASTHGDATSVNLAATPTRMDHRVLYYRNPMGLPDTSLVPKKDSMGMDYIPVYADDASHNDPPGMVRISAGRMQTLGVTSEPVTLKSAAGRTIRATGTLQFDERGLATVTTRVSGWIDHLVVAATGDPVKRGQVLAKIYSPDAVASEREYLVALQVGEAIGEASDQRLGALGVPDDEIERLQRTHHVSHTIAVLAPEDGVVIEKPVQEGMRINAGDPLYRTADLSDIWLIAQVQEQDLGEIKPGDRASASFVAFPGRTFEGRVDFIYPALSPETRTGRVRIILPNPDRLLREQMYAAVAIDAGSHGQPALMVPESAVLDNGAKQVVLLDLGNGRFEPRSVRLGFRNDGAVQVLNGVKAGDRVVTGANFLIDAESNLRAALQGFTSGDQSQSTQSGANQ